MFLRCAYFELFYVLLPLLALALIYRWRFYQSPLYVYPLSEKIAQARLSIFGRHQFILSTLRFLALGILAFLITRPQWVDERSKVHFDGIDIVLAIDVSSSMLAFDDSKDQRNRFSVAQQEAIRFIEKRTNDPIGIVIFAKNALSQCPLTLDKSILKDIVGRLEIGAIDPSETWLGTGLAVSINRLKNSKAKTKLIILLTDGEPTAQEKIDPTIAIQLAQQFGIKIYTIGVGSEKGAYFNHPYLGLQHLQTSLNKELLEKIASSTGGQFFLAQNPKDMRLIYDKIDSLEKINYETDLFQKYYEAFLTFIWIVFLLLGLELALRLFIWRGVW